MHIVSVSLQIDSAGQTRVILRSLQLHLKRKCQICLLILIPEIIDISCLARAAESVKEHKFSGGSALQFRHQSGVLRHFISVQIYHHLNGRILCKQLFHFRKRPGISIVSGFHIILSGMMKYPVAVLFRKHLCQIFSHSHNTCVHISRHRICKCLLGMGVIDQDLWTFSLLFRHGHIDFHKLIHG